MSVDTAPPASPAVGGDSHHEHARATVRPDKAAAVAELAAAFRTAGAAVLTEYRGLSVSQVTALRVALGADTTYAVVKNTLTRLAAADAGLEGLDELLTGPTAVAFISGEPVEAARTLRDYARANPALVVKGGVLDGKPLTADEIRRLADLESREVLLAKLAGAMKASLTQAVYLFSAPLAQVARLAAALQDKAEQDPSVLQGGAGSPPSPPSDGAAERVADASAEPVADVAAEPMADGAVEPMADVAAERVADASAEPVADGAAEPMADVAVATVAVAPAEPAAGVPATVGDAASEGAADSAGAP